MPGIRNREAYSRRHMWWMRDAGGRARSSRVYGPAGVERAETAGSLRRGLETVGDLDFIVGRAGGGARGRWFTGQPGVKEVTAKGGDQGERPPRGGHPGRPADRPAGPVCLRAAPFHGVEGPQRADAPARPGPGDEPERMGPCPRPPGRARPGSKAERREGVAADDEEAIFRALGLAFIPPELREGLGEIEAAEKGEIPKARRAGATCAGRSTTTRPRRTGAARCGRWRPRRRRSGWEYLGIADHSKSSRQARGLTEERLLGQLAEIAALNASRKFRTRVFVGDGVRHPSRRKPGLRGRVLRPTWTTWSPPSTALLPRARPR